LRALFALACVETLVGIALTHATQGWLVVLSGAAIVLFGQVRKLRKGFQAIYLVVAITGLFSVTLGILKIGPLSKYLYKASVAYRGDYWRAAWRMAWSHPVVGVGLDRYGENFRIYRDAAQVARRGQGIASNVAHNVALQLAATGGFLLFLTYLALIIIVTISGFQTLIRQGRNTNAVQTLLFAAWIGYLAQSTISIDQIGLATWGWMLAGMVLNLSFGKRETISTKRPKRQKNTIEFSSIAVKGICIGALVGLGWISYQFNVVETEVHKIFNTPPPAKQSDSTTRAAYCSFAETPLHSPLIDQNYVNNIAAICSNFGYVKEARAMLLHYSTRDPMNYDYFNNLAVIDEHEGQAKTAIEFRKRIKILDPLNALNLQLLNTDLKSVG
jgi:hypothetical protein